MKRVLYLHGLESSQGGKKVDFLSSQGMVYAPSLDYKDPECFANIYSLILKNDFDLIIGSSMGGYLAFTMGEIFQVPTILFNPALHSRSFEPNNHFKPKLGISFHTVVVGDNDELIDSSKTIEFLEENKIEYKIFHGDHGHRTPLDVFITTFNRYA